MPRRRQR